MIGVALSILRGLSFQAWLVAGAAVAAAVVFGVFVSYERGVGARKIVDQINRQNQEARDAARQGARDVTDCYYADGVWNVRDQKCNRP